jgi:hypothetical protein
VVARAAHASSARAERGLTWLKPMLPRLRALGALAAVAIVVDVAVRAGRHVHPDQLTLWPLALALVAAVGWWLGLGRGWALLANGESTLADVRTWCRTQTLRYLPGGFWAPASRTTVIQGSWLDRISTVAAENILALCAALAIGGLALGLSESAWWLALLAVMAVPTLGSRALSARTRLAPERTRRASINYYVAFLGYAYAAVLVQAAVSGLHHPLAVAGAATIAWAAGLVVVFAPSGVGVREVVYVGLLSGVLPSGQLAAGAVTMRIVMVLAELGVLLAVGRPKIDRAAVRAKVGAIGARLRPDWAFVRRHAFFGVLLGVGAGLRAIAWLAYQPALIFWDSASYLAQAPHLRPDALRPLGYPAFLKLLPFHHWLAVIPLVQHIMGLGMAVLIYVLLQRLSVPAWGAALAAAPVLLDGFQLDLEQYVLSETMFDCLILIGCALLLWRPKLSVLRAALAGLVFALVALTRANGLIAIGPVVLALICLRWESSRAVALKARGAGARALHAPVRWLRSLRPSLVALLALLALFIAPIGAYAVWFHSVNNVYGITDWGGRFLYARVAPIADCTKFTVPADERHLCPKDPVGKRPRVYGSSVEYYMWGRSSSPVWTLPVTEDQRRKLAGDFAKRVIENQPLTYAKTVAHDFLRAFYPVPAHRDGELPIFRWQFQTFFPLYFLNEYQYIAAFGKAPHLDKPLARFLKAYRGIGFTPGPVFAICLIAGLLAAFGVGRARRSRMRTAALLFTTMGIAIFGSSVLTNQFGYRYYVPLIALVPPAGALGLTALIRRPGDAARIPKPVPG